ncbi:nucleolar protein 14 [Coprinopsis marcescibilis]|uniref:Nucleolar protein 14 n=1 Tax=Coprinopsis marcescibilis TaxID=230819 RepID=A0A5C3L0L3_COPMA|nr:nucleolar protein 14 [Coprinopsis marcescibilis]
MAKGSQLSQLKTALASAGVLGQKPSSKKRKRSSVPLEKEKQRTAAKLEEIHRRLNPFDEKVTKLKHDVGGRKLKGVSGKPAKSKQAGLEQRKKSLLKEWQEKGRAGGIIDRRFGENDASMGLEERMLERFTRERQRTSTASTFNLEGEDELTHYGQSLSARLDDFDDIDLRENSDEEDEFAGQLNREIVSHTHFGGFDQGEDEASDSEGPPKKKSKAEVMAEVMAKSKEHKLRRQMEKDREETIRTELDDQFSELRDLIFSAPPAPQPNPTTAENSSQPIEQDVDVAIMAPETQDLAYDQRVRELAFDKRSKPTDRTKTDEELALEAKEALEKAERQRKRRMQGLPDSDDEGEGRGKGKRKRGGDDLDDDFMEEEEWSGLGDGLAGANLSANVEAQTEDSASGWEDEDEEEEGSDETGEEDSDNESGEEGASGDEDEESGALVSSVKKDKGKAKSKSKSSSNAEIPYTFPCPESHDEFLEIVEDIDDKHTSTVVQRIRALYHTSLSPDNKFKLQGFGSVLIDHILHVASSTPPRLQVINAIYPHLTAITKAYPIPIARYFNEKLSLMHKNLKRGLSQGAHDPKSRTWPGLAELSFLRVIGRLWPTSDLHHAVISPARVLMGAYLGLCRVRTLADISSGLFLCTLWLQYETLSKHLVPEAINFLINSILHLAPNKIDTIDSLAGSFPSPDFGSDALKRITLKKSKIPLAPRTANICELSTVTNDSDEQAKTDLLALALELLTRFADMYKGLDGFIELFEPVQAVLEGVQRKKLHEILQYHQTRLTKLEDMVTRLLKFAHQSRQPLHLQAHKPIPIPTYVPKFETTSSNYLRQRDPDYERNEAARLKTQYKQEKKGAIRELRKDARFLASVEHQKQTEKDRSYNDRMKRVFASIEPERAEQKAAEREKSKEKRRAGRK